MLLRAGQRAFLAQVLPRFARPAVLRAFSSRSSSPEETPVVSEQPRGTAPQNLAVDPLPVAAWSPDLVNRVTITGTVLSEPSLHAIGGSQTVANVLLSLRARFGHHHGNQTVALEGWGYTSLQMVQYVRPGQQLLVEGHLKENIWTDRATNQERRKLKVVVEKLHVIPPPEHSQQAAEGQEWRTEEAQQQQQQQQQVVAAAPAESKPRVFGPTMKAAYQLFQDEGLSFHGVAGARNIKLSTAVDYAITGASFGLPLDWARAASELQLGPKGSPWLTADEVWQAICDAHAELFPGEPVERSERLMQLPLRRVYELLSAGESTCVKLGAQESVADGKWVTYGQIKLVTWMAIKGFDWNSKIVEMPVQLPRAAAPEQQAPPPF